VKLFLIDRHILKRKRTKFYIEQVMLQSTVLMRMLNYQQCHLIFLFFCIYFHFLLFQVDVYKVVECRKFLIFQLIARQSPTLSGCC
jgi:hypothetical protein